MTPPNDEYVELPGRGPSGGSLRVHYRDWDGTGTPVVLLHGLSSSCRIWDLTAPLLAREFRVVAVDLRGHGLTDRPDSDYTFAEVCSDLDELLLALGFDRPILVGHSWGAGVALQFAAGQPGRVAALVLVDGGMTEISARLTWEQAEKVMRPPVIDGVPVERFVGFARSWPFVRDIWSPQFQEMLLSNFLVHDGKVYRRLTMENHMKVVRAIYNQKPTDLYPRIQAPVLLVPAEREPDNDQERAWQAARETGLEAAQRLLPEARLVVMKDTPHDVPVFRPEHLARAIIKFGRNLA
ncbi:MAG TPA: alpha/beta hydrolase [Dehalococcoidia bacterium]|nr:alpha/beta hydrolase [Dehalococcoidia bacterium]